MNDFFFLIPVAILIVILVPALMEIFRRRDLGPRVIPESTIFYARDHINSVRALNTPADPLPYQEERDLVLPVGTEWRGDIVIHGDLRLGDNCHVNGTLKASGETRIGDFSTIEGNVLSKGRVKVGQYCVILGVIVSLQEVTLGANTSVEAVSTEKTVRLERGVRIKRRISGTAIVSRDQET